MANATLFYVLFHSLVLRRVHFIYSSLLAGCLVVWTWSGLDDCLFWGYIVVIVVIGLKSAEEFSHSPRRGTTVRTLVNRQMGRLEWTNHIYFQITHPAVVTLHLCTNRECNVPKRRVNMLLLFPSFSLSNFRLHASWIFGLHKFIC